MLISPPAELLVSNPLVFAAAPIVLASASVFVILQVDNDALSQIDLEDPAAWQQSSMEWLPGAPIENEYFSPIDNTVSVADHGSGKWRTLRRYGSIQSVTLFQDSENGVKQPVHLTTGNEYLKVMASAYAALCTTTTTTTETLEELEIGKNRIKQQQLKEKLDYAEINNSRNKEGLPDKSKSSILTISKETEKKIPSDGGILHLGLGSGTLPMLLDEEYCDAVELDTTVVDMAIEYCGLDTDRINIVRGGNALQHRELLKKSSSNDNCKKYSCIFVDVFGNDNNVPIEFVQSKFVSGLYDSISDDGGGGWVIANFHYGGTNRAEEERLNQAKIIYSEIFDTCLMIPSRYQNNMIFCARKKGNKETEDVEISLDIEKAQKYALRKGWLFDPASRLKRWKMISPKKPFLPF